MRIPPPATLFLSLLAFTVRTTPPAFAQQAPPARGATLTDEQGRVVPGVRLEKVGLGAVIQGPLARVTVTLTFANAGDGIVGGELAFPLPAGATVTGYGLEVNGSIVDGVAVEKQQAGTIYEGEVRHRVDPGLVEHVAGNAFRTRLYPIAARGSRSARVQYLTEVACTRDGATVSLPTGWGDAKQCDVRIEAPDATVEPAVKAGGAGLAFRRTAHGFVAEGELREVADELVIALAAPPGPAVLIERRPRDGTGARMPAPTPDGQAPDEAAPEERVPDERAADAGVRARAEWRDPARYFQRFDYWFLLNDVPPAPPAGPAPAAAAELRAKPVRRVAVLWDAGLTRAGSDKSRELKLLESLLQGWAGAGGGIIGDLVVFRDTAEPPVRFDATTPAGRTDLLGRLGRLIYDGASDPGDLPLPGNVGGFAGAGAAPAGGPAGDYDCLLLFSDGTGGIGPPGMRRAPVPVYAFSDDARADRARLQQVCRDSGGRFFDLRQFDAEVSREPWSLLSVESAPGAVAEVYPARAAPVSVEGSGRLTLTGRLLAPEATITLNYGYGSVVTCRRRFTLRIGRATAGGPVACWWAGCKVAELSADPEANDPELAGLGRRFNLVTPNTSLLVLETADQYERYRVTPPKNRPRLLQQFLEWNGRPRAPERLTPEQRLRPVLWAWGVQVRWWENPAEFFAPEPVAPGNTFYGAPYDAPRQPEDWPDPRTLERRETARHAANLRQSRELAREAGRARQSGDLTGARDLYAEAVVIAPGDPAAARGMNEVVAELTGQPPPVPPRERLAEREFRRAAEAAAAFQAALDRSAQDVEHDDLAGADFEIDQAREALGDGLSAPDREQRQALDARLAAAKRRVDAARIAAARNAPAARAKRTADARAAGDDARGPLTYGRGYGGGFGGGGGRGGGFGGGSLFGAGGGGLRSGPPAAEAGAAPPRPAGASIGSAVVAAPLPVAPWDPARPWLAAMRGAPAQGAYEVFLKQREAFGRSPGFYLDCAEHLERIGRHAMAVRVATDVAAFHPAGPSLLRKAAYCLDALGERDRAVELFERVLEMRPRDVHNLRDLATALSDRADALADLPRGDSRRDGGRIAADYGRCLELLTRAVTPGEVYSQSDVGCVVDANRVIARAERLQRAWDIPPVPVPLDPRLVRDLECDLRLVIASDSDGQTQVSVTEPRGETISGGPYATRIGGWMDGGYGSAEYRLRRLSPGLYRVQARFVGWPKPGAGGRCTLRVTAFTSFGRADEKRARLSVAVSDNGTPVEVGVVAAEGAAPVFQKANDGPTIGAAP